MELKMRTKSAKKPLPVLLPLTHLNEVSFAVE